MYNLVILVIVAWVLYNHFLKMGEGFENPLPYDNLETTHYKQMYSRKDQPKNPELTEPGYFKDYLDIFDDPKLLNSFWLGYSVNGVAYNDYDKRELASKKVFDVTNPNHRFHYPNWYQKDPRKNATYIGYPSYFHGKVHR